MDRLPTGASEGSPRRCYVNRLTGDDISQPGFDTKCANDNTRDVATLVSNMPTGQLSILVPGSVVRNRWSAAELAGGGGIRQARAETDV